MPLHFFCSLSLFFQRVNVASTFVLANLFSHLSVAHATGFSCIERSHRRSHACIRPFPLSIPRIALYVVDLVLHLHPPPFPVFDRECKYTAVSLPTRNRARCIAIGERRQR
jgi:hypothetical protein